MNFYKIDLANELEAKKLFNKIGSDDIGSKIIAKKTKLHAIYIKDLHVGAANILKQDALSIGADLAVPMGTIIAQDQYVDAILIGTSKHFEILSKKELIQPFGLKTLASELKNFITPINYKTKIMGVINANDDSFFSQSRFVGDDAIKKIHSMIKDGADIIDIGGVSTRPGSDPVQAQEELNRIKPICDIIKEQELFKKITFSIDSYTPSVIEYALESGFTIVNDVTALSNDEVAKVTAKYKASIIIMHMQGTPKNMQNNPTYDDLIIDIDNFFKKRIEKAKKYGIENIILDVGIGFGKTLEHNLQLLKNMDHFLHFGYEVLVGASRKSMIDKIIPTPTKERLSGTLAIHLDSLKRGASIVRCHDVKEHFYMIKTLKALRDISI